MWDKVRNQAEFEFSQLNKLLEANSPLLEKVKSEEPSSVEALAFGAILHSFYMGIENIFKRIAKEIDRGLPEGPNWHMELLNSMMQANECRQAVISGELKDVLEDYLLFRHAFRNLYSFNLKWAKFKPLALNMGKTLEQLQEEIRAFFAGGKKEG